MNNIIITIITINTTGFHEQFASIVKGLESACEEGLTFSLLGGDTR